MPRAAVRQDGGVTVAVAGDGAMNQGGVFEAMNLAAVRSLSMLFLVEDNRYSTSAHSTISKVNSSSHIILEKRRIRKRTA